MGAVAPRSARHRHCITMVGAQELLFERIIDLPPVSDQTRRRAGRRHVLRPVLAIACERNVVKVDDDIPFELLAPPGWRVQTGIGAVTRSLAAEKGSIVVADGGSVGLPALMGAVPRECATIIVVEPTARRRDLARDLGATRVALTPHTPTHPQGGNRHFLWGIRAELCSADHYTLPTVV